MSPDLDAWIWAELDKLMSEPPTKAEDIGAELSALMLEFRDCKETERPRGDR